MGKKLGILLSIGLILICIALFFIFLSSNSIIGWIGIVGCIFVIIVEIDFIWESWRR